MVIGRKLKRNRQSIVYGVTAGTSAYSLLRGQLAWFSQRGWDVTLVTNPDKKAHDASEREGVPLVPVPMSREISLLADFKSLCNWIRVLRTVRPAITNVGTPKAGLLGGIAAFITRVPRRIYVVRGLRLEGTSGLVSKVLWLMERISIAVATDVVVVSDSLGELMLEKSLINPEKAVVIGHGSSNGVDAEAIARRVAEVDVASSRAELRIPHDALVVGFVGRLTQDKGINTLVDAARELRNDSSVYFLVIGNAEGSFDTSSLIESNPNVRWIDGTNDVPQYLAVMDVLALPTYREGFPNVVLEAASAGVPTITTRATGAIDSVIDAQTGFLFDVGDTSAFVSLVRKFASDPVLSKRLGRSSTERVRTQFRQDGIWNGLESIYLNSPISEVRGIGQEETLKRSMDGDGLNK